MADPVVPPVVTPPPAAPEVKPPAAPEVKPPAAPEVKPPAEAVKIEEKKVEEPKKAEERKSLLGKKGEEKKPEPTAEEKAAAEKLAAETKAKEEADTKIDIKLPEGFTAPKETIAAFTKLAEESGLKGPAAQKVIDMYVAHEQERAKAEEVASNELQDKWEAEIQKWPDADEKLGLAKRAIEKLGSPEAQAWFNDTIFGSNPHIVAMMAAAGALMKEDPLVEGNSQPAQKDWYEGRFPNSKPVVKK